MLHLHPLSEVTSRSEPASVSSLELSACLGCCNHWIRTQIFHSNLTLRRDSRKMCQCHHYWGLKKLAKISLANVGATSCMYYGDMARNLDFEIKSSEFTNYCPQVRDSPPAMTSPTVRTVSGSCSARGAHRVPSPSQVSNICDLRNTTVLNYLTHGRMFTGCMLLSSLFISPFS